MEQHHERPRSHNHDLDLDLEDLDLSEHTLELGKEFGVHLSGDRSNKPEKERVREISPDVDLTDSRLFEKRDRSDFEKRDAPVFEKRDHEADGSPVPQVEHHYEPRKQSRNGVGLNDVVTFALIATVSLGVSGKFHTSQAPEPSPTTPKPTEVKPNITKSSVAVAAVPRSEPSPVEPKPQKKEYKDLKVGDVVVNPPIQRERYFILSDSYEQPQLGNQIQNLILVENQRVKAIVPAQTGRADKQGSSQSSRRNRVGQGDPPPNGTYSLGPRQGSSLGEIGVFEGVRVFIGMHSPTQGSRSALGLHIDTSWGRNNGENGTMGCVGIRKQDAALVFGFYEAGADAILVFIS